MIEETGEVIEVGQDYLKVTSRPKSGCGNCATEKGCGQGLLNRWGAKSIVLTLPLNGQSPAEYKRHDRVLVGVPENVLLRSVFLLYLTPLLAMIVGVLLGNWLFRNDVGVALLAVTGLCLGALVTRRCVQLFTAVSTVSPVLLGKAEPAS